MTLSTKQRRSVEILSGAIAAVPIAVWATGYYEATSPAASPPAEAFATFLVAFWVVISAGVYFAFLGVRLRRTVRATKKRAGGPHGER